MKLIGRISSAAIAILSAPLQYRAMQCLQIQEMSFNQDYDSIVGLSEEVKEELEWWYQNLLLSNGRSLVSPTSQLIISSDASQKGWETFYKSKKTTGQWSAQELEIHINGLELKAAKLTTIVFYSLFPSTFGWIMFVV